MTMPTLTPQEYVLIKAGLNRLKYSIMNETRSYPEHSPEQLERFEMAEKLDKLARKFDLI